MIQSTDTYNNSYVFFACTLRVLYPLSRGIVRSSLDLRELWYLVDVFQNVRTPGVCRNVYDASFMWSL